MGLLSPRAPGRHSHAWSSRKCSRTFVFKEPSSRFLPYCNHFTGFVILFCQNQDGSMGMITVAQIVYKETILRKNLTSHSLLSLALELDNKITSEVNGSCPFFRASSPSFKAWKLHPELRRPCASSKGSNSIWGGQGAGLSSHLSATIRLASPHTQKAPLPFHCCHSAGVPPGLLKLP